MVLPAPGKQSKPAAASEHFDFEVLLTLLFLRKRVMLLSLIATIAVTVVLTVIQLPQYEASFKILAEPSKDENPTAIELRSQQERKAFIETQKELVLSRSVLQAALAATNGTPESSVRQSDIDRLASRVLVGSRSQMGTRFFTGSGVGESNTFFVSVRDGDPDRAAKLAEALLAAYLKRGSSVRGDQAVRAEASLKAAVEASTIRTKEAHQRLATFEAQTGALLAELININKDTVRLYPELADIRQAAETAKAELTEKRALIASISRVMESNDPTAIPLTLISTSSALQFLKVKHTELTYELNSVLPFFHESSREVDSIRENRAGVEVSIREELGRILAGERLQLAAMQSALETREQTLSQYDAKLSEISRLNNQHAELRREYEGNARALDTQIQALAEATIAARRSEAGSTNVAVLDPPVPNERAVSPRYLLNLLLSIPIGILIGFVAIITGQMIRPVVIHPRQVEILTRIPVVTTVPRLKGEAR